MRKTRFIVIAIAVFVVAGAAALAVGVLRPAGAAGAAGQPATALLTLPAIPGTTDRIETPLTSVKWGISSPLCATCGPGGGAGTGKAVLKEIVVTRPIDSLSPALFKVVATGQHFDTASIKLLNAAGQAYFEYQLTAVFLTNIDHSATGAGDGTETLTLVYGALKVE